MVKKEKSLDLDSRVKLSRRSFLQGMAAVGATATVAGCSKGGDGETIFVGGGTTLEDTITPLTPEELANADIYYGSCIHNCGAGVRCVSKFHVVNGRIVRVTSDDSDYAFDGTYRDKEQYNDSRALTCAKGRAFKWRVYAPNRLKYALKQTKKRGDMSGFVRIPVSQAMQEIAQKYRSIHAKYGAGAILSIYGTSGGYASVGTYANNGSARSALVAPANARSFYSDYSYHQYHYGQPLTGHPGVGGAYSKPSNVAWQFPAIIGAVKNVVSWGSNILSTNNTVAWGYIKSMEELKKRGGKAYFVGPELTDTGVTCHTDWVQLRNYTDTALIMSMFYEMIINTFNEDGSIKANPWLDVDYIDTMVYGFFDSPEYWVSGVANGYFNGTNTTLGSSVVANPISTNAGTITLTAPAGASDWKRELGSWWINTGTGAVQTASPFPTTGWTNISERWQNQTNTAVYAYSVPFRKVEAVEPGKSLASYVMGSDDRLTKANYTAGNNYTAVQFGDRPRAGLCSWNVLGQPAHSAPLSSSKYLYKQQMMTPKTPEWAEKICGTPAGTIRNLAKMYCDPAQHPIFNEWAGGFQKQENGVVNVFSVTALMCVTKTFGLSGETFSGPWASTFGFGPVANPAPNITATVTSATTSGPGDTRRVSASVKEWFNGIKLAFFDELKANGYTGKHIPDWDQTSRYYSNDGGVKAGVMLAGDGRTAVQTETIDGKTTFKYAKDGDGKPVYAGTRMIISAAGGIMVNQHMNTNDTTEMYKCLPISGDPTNADTLCLVQFDIFMSPSARFSDYVLPGVSNLEAVDLGPIGGQSACYRPPIVKPVGEALDSWTMAYEAYKAQEKLGNYNTADFTDAGAKYVGTNGSTKKFKPVQEYYDDAVNTAIASGSRTRFEGMTKKEVYANIFTPAKPNEAFVISTASPHYETKATAVSGGSTATATRGDLSPAGQIRKNLDEYLALDVATRKTTPFVFVTKNSVDNIFTADTYTSGRGQIIDELIDNRPHPAGRFQVYNGMMKFEYENAFSKYHGWLPAEERGQSNKDYEGDLKVYPIPMYFNFEDCFNEAFGVFNGKADNDLSKKGGLTLGTTHDRFRVHSTHNENPFLRELNHRTRGGKWASANDWNEYAIVPSRQLPGLSAPFSPMISSAVYNKNANASWHEIWINSQDAADRGIADGDLVRVENPIGAIRVIARVTDRCVRGHLNLHQGGWYDPNPNDGVDDGGCANTLISSKPSRIDHGNAQQMCYVTIRKESSF